MGRLEKGMFGLVFIGCVSGASLIPSAHAGDGVIVLERTVQPHVATRSLMRPDPNPTTVNTNVSSRVTGALNNGELSDGDFATVTSGATINHMLMPNGTLRGLNTVDRGVTAGLGAGHSGGATSGIGGQVTGAVQQGLAPLRMMTGDH
ncbi:hypothetical protein QN400_15160 [Pseudomonas sp. RTC3]|mgnify:CR=1 FL=1|uniref:hypothetical protein n=1 Tax=unclassified Pseudomonas TaxID=196821 RepID=UPI002AB53DF7|nr:MULTISPECIES: hypothetical protein [unclassified Pseudomonas]MEB0063366.1 hypothetical protein [Pseudomonas sp. RTC3]MDY7564887.1 hypothetical protein [Pseudomonas sp. 5C2]MEB0006535.1 hypothetical protein [Pseudomonas sp. RTB2]MEB0018136.1 hypothetical protein [Pseudomonas sp. RTB3]MEB0028230.1 hypothetical protein [Pseudomonas sp. MH9.2]